MTTADKRACCDRALLQSPARQANHEQISAEEQAALGTRDKSLQKRRKQDGEDLLDAAKETMNEVKENTATE